MKPSRSKHSSLFCIGSIDDEEKKFYQMDTCGLFLAFGHGGASGDVTTALALTSLLLL
jgi:hypothetical protein